MQAYYYIPIEEKEDILSCGIKLSVKADRIITINDTLTTFCISALLNPKDDLEKYKSYNFICLRLEIKDEYCYIANKDLLHIEDFYEKSVTKLSDYILGSYSAPECLITCTILPESISIKNKVIDFPILYDNSRDLYLNNLIYDMKDVYNNYDEVTLGLFLENLCSNGKFKKIEKNDLSIYTGKSGQTYIIRNRKEI